MLMNFSSVVKSFSGWGLKGDFDGWTGKMEAHWMDPNGRLKA
jgi:hypothetical protein